MGAIIKSHFPIFVLVLLFGSVYPKVYEVKILNEIHPSYVPMKIHCASRDDDLGNHTLLYLTNFIWHFRPAVIGSTLFFCHFWWGKKEAVFDVFSEKWSKICETPDQNLCLWVARIDGIYFTNNLYYEDKDLVKKYTWKWWYSSTPYVCNNTIYWMLMLIRLSFVHFLSFALLFFSVSGNPYPTNRIVTLHEKGIAWQQKKCGIFATRDTFRR